MKKINFYNSILEKFILPLGDLVMDSSVMKNLKEWRRVTQLSEKEIEKYSCDKLYHLLDFVTRSVPYYHQFISYKNENPYEWINHFPIMGKAEIKNNISTLLSKPKEKLILSSTSGSSGEYGAVYKEKKDISTGQSLILLIWGWAGYKPGMSILQTGMTANRGFVKSMKDFLLRTDYYVAFGLSDEEVETLLLKYRNKKNVFLIGYASSLYVLADVCIKKRITGVQFRKAISLGDKMFPHYRKRIKDAFGCDVNDTYGCSEGLTIAAQKDNEYYYIITPHVYLELLDEKGQAVPDGEIGHVIATSLDARAMPLIRYDTGDLAIKLPRDKYPIHRDLELPLLEKIIGRDTDIVKTATGKYMIVHFFTGIFEFVPEIKQFKVVQRDLNSMEIEYIPATNFSENVCRDVEKQIHDYLREPFKISWKKVDYIAPTPSGKPQIIQSFLKKEI